MTKTITVHAHQRKSHDWHADTKKFLVPKMIKEYWYRGTRFYRCEGGKKFIADTYDACLRAIPGKLFPRGYKGELIGGFYE